MILRALLVATAVAAGTAAAAPAPRNGKIAFWVDLGPAAVFTIDPDGTHRRRLTAGDVRSKGASWSPDGKRIAIYGTASRAEDDNFDVFVVDADGSHRRRLTRGHARDVLPAWSRDGRRIAYAHGDDVWVMNADGSNQHLLVRNAGEAAWGPGGRFAFGRLARGRVDIWVGNRRLTGGPGDSEMPAWSPDGRRIAFVWFRAGEPDVWVMDADGSHKRSLTTSPARDDSPSWSPDGRRIVFTSYRDGNGELYVMDADGSHQRRVTHSAVDEDADGWQPLPR